MLLLFGAIGISVLAGYAAGGRLRRFESAHIRLWWLVLLGLALQEAPVGSHRAAMALLMVSYVTLVIFATANLRCAGFGLILLGLALNWLVIAANGGMPVSRDALARPGQAEALQLLETEGGAKHRLSTAEDNFIFLADVIPVGGPLAQVVSAGDILVYAGIGWYIVATMRGPRDEREDEGSI